MRASAQIFKTAHLLCIFSFFMLFMFTSSTFALSGKIVDSDGEPIIGATIATNIAIIGTLTKEDGSFMLPENELITTITISSVGFKSRNFVVNDIPSEIILETVYYKTGDILVSADRAELGITPIAFENLSSDEIERDYTVGEFPLLLQSTPNLHSYADGGGSLGYSYIRIRGFDDKRIVTYINGVPLNDPEDHATYFVDLPDFPANVTDIQVQRGVGNSLYGDASFGGTINIVTSSFNTERKTSLSTGYGEYKGAGDIYKQSLSYSSGLVDGKWVYNGRFSKQKSGGYKHNSWYEGWAYYFSVGRIDPKMTTELFVYGGPIRMHLAYNGEPRTSLDIDRKSNSLSYSNETDNFNQPHYHLHNVYKLSEQATLANTFYYIRGKGYYEQLKESSSYIDYNLTNFSDSSSGDIVRQQWVRKNQYGWNPRLDIKHNKGTHTIGGSFFSFDSDHWGQVVWAEHLDSSGSPQQKYYQYYGKKQVASFFVQEYYHLNEKLSAQVTGQLRYQQYKLNSDSIGAFIGYGYNVDWLFFSPRIGVNYKQSDNVSIFANFSVASRTPSDAAIYDANDPEIVPSLDSNGNPTAKSERVYDYEFGINYLSHNYSFSANLFYMNFKNEIVPYGGINSNGIAYTTNLEKSIHSGIELTGAIALTEQLSVNGNFSYNSNKIKEFVDIVEINSNDWSTTRDSAFDLSENTIPAFPEILSNVIVDYHTADFQFTASSKFLGEQFAEIHNIDSLKIKSAFVASISSGYTFRNVLGDGNLILKVRIDNIFDKKYEVSGYGWIYGHDNSSGEAQMIKEAEYYIAPGRSIYGQLKLELF